MAHPEGITRLPDWPQQTLRGHKIDGYRYSSRDFFAQEWEQMWTRVWLLMGRQEEIPLPGDWQREDVGPESILMVRQKDGGIKAFYNVCQHRGKRLVDAAKGHAGRFVCPYHAWAYTTDGELNFVQDPDDYPQGNPCGKLRLVELRCETFGGFIWINMDPDCVPLKQFLGPVWDDWEGYELANWRRYEALSTTAPFNWKVVIDNFSESYHVNTVHRPRGDVDTKRLHPGIDTNYRNTRFDLSNEGHNRMIMRGGYAGPAIDSDGIILEPLASIMREWQIDPADFTGRGEATREALQQARRELGPGRGYSHYRNLTNDQLTDAVHYTLFPNMAASIWADGFHFLRVRPHPTDPEQCVFDNWWYASEPDGETMPVRTTASVVERGTKVEHQLFEFGSNSMGPVIDEDLAIMPGQQAGLRSRAYRGAYLAGQESRLQRYHEVIDDYIANRLPVRAATNK